MRGMNSFPAIVIGGPPHSGKSVLTYLLTQHLRAWGVEHYVLRACPDGEGDWSQEAPPERVRVLRQKGEFSDAFVDRVCRDLARRHLPLLVDVGGKPTPSQERILDVCTHAVLVAHDDHGLATWRELAGRHGLAVVAELRSTLTGVDRIVETWPVLRAQVAHLERHTAMPGVVVATLAERLRDLLAYDTGELRQHHLASAPTELAVDLEQLAAWLDLPDAKERWQPGNLSSAVGYLPKAAISLYGRGPNWLYAALALHIAPHPFFLYDARLGWREPVPLMLSDSAQAMYLSWEIDHYSGHTHLSLAPGIPYLDYDEIAGATLPVLAAGQGVVLGGKVPHWLLVGAALVYRAHPWIAVYQPQLGDEAVIVFSRTDSLPIGATISMIAARQHAQG